MRVSRDESLTAPFRLTIDDMRRLATSFQQNIGPPSLSAECADALTRQFATVDSLEEYENTATSAIRTLRISARSKDAVSQVTLSFDTDDSNNVRVRLESDEDRALALNKVISDRLEAMRPWYAAVWRFDPVLVLLALTVIPAFALLAAVAVGLIRLTNSPTDDYGLAVARGYVLGLAPLILGALLGVARRRVFPIAAYIIGQGKKRDRTVELVRNGLVLSLAISVAGSLIATWMTAP